MYRKQHQGYDLSIQSISSFVINKKWSVRQNIVSTCSKTYVYSKFQIKVSIFLNAKHIC